MFCPIIVSILIVSVFADRPPSYHTHEEAKIPYAYSYSVKDEYHGPDFNAVVQQPQPHPSHPQQPPSLRQQLQSR